MTTLLTGRFPDVRSRVRSDEEAQNVATTSLAYDRMAVKWELCSDLVLGTDAMRAANVKWLPRFEGEDIDLYTTRLNGTFLFNFYSDAIDKLSGAPFEEEIKITPENPPQLITDILKDVDRQGTSLNTWARRAFKTALDRGLLFCLIEYPREGVATNRAAERALAVRPYFKMLPPENVLGPRWRVLPDGREVLDRVRILETRVEPFGEYGEQQIDYVMVWDAPVAYTDDERALAQSENRFEDLLGRWELWRHESVEGQALAAEQKLQDAGQSLPARMVWIKIEEGTHSYPGVPLEWYIDPVTMVDKMEADPPLWRLAELNLEHYQKKSDRDHLLHVAMVPILTLTGWPDDPPEKDRAGNPVKRKKFTLGAGALLRTSADGASAAYTEHSGKAIGAGTAELERIELRAELVALQPLVQKSGVRTATERNIDRQAKMSTLQAAAIDFGAFIVRCCKAAARWESAAPNAVTGAGQLPEDFNVSIFTDFALPEEAAAKAKDLLQARIAGQISRATFLEGWKELGHLSAKLDVQAEIQAIEDEAASMMTLMAEQGQLAGENNEDNGGEAEDDSNGGQDADKKSKGRLGKKSALEEAVV